MTTPTDEDEAAAPVELTEAQEIRLSYLDFLIESLDKEIDRLRALRKKDA